MRKQRIFLFVITLVCFVLNQGLSQQKSDDKKVKEMIALGMAPGLGTSGIRPNNKAHLFSFNLTASYAYSTSLFSLSTFSNFNEGSSSGLMISSFYNLVGGNSLKFKDEKYNSTVIHYHGLQVTGLINRVNGELRGVQFSGISSLVNSNIVGSQFSGLISYSKGYVIGTQLSGISNFVSGPMSGVQFSTGLNFVRNDFNGLQISSINISHNLRPITSENKNTFGFQIGLLNYSTNSDGVQIGLINIARSLTGKQFGIFNFYKLNERKKKKSGYSIGLLNFGKLQNLEIRMDELYFTNYEISTGNLLNGGFDYDKSKKFLINKLGLSFLPIKHSNSYSINYSLFKYWFNKSTLPGMSESRFIGFGGSLRLINLFGSKENQNPVIYSGEISIGHRFFPKLYGINVNLNLALRYSRNVEFVEATRMPYFKLSNLKGAIWPGFGIGILMH